MLERRPDSIRTHSEAAPLAKMPFGAELIANGQVRFRLWAPACDHVRVRLDHQETLLPLVATRDGWHELATDAAGPGSRYFFRLPNGGEAPDPASRFQPEGVHGPSEIVDPDAFAWSDGNWRGLPWPEAVIYELHVGAFTPAGTFGAAIDKLDHLANLGVTAIELMPIAEFAGRRNWGYDGVFLFAPDSSYGGPDELRRLVNAAHSRGIMVLLDVVYNHFGPEGNYLSAYAPSFFTERHQTPWGPAINYDDGSDARIVRDFVIHNALYWLREFHIDGLRLDAVHAIKDSSEKILIAELAETLRAAQTGRAIHLILENENNEARHLTGGGVGPSRYTAQWNDDVHHVLHTAATGERQAYYADYVGRTDRLARALAEGFAFQGERMDFRGSARGEPSGGLPPEAFIAFLQNHDQIGNRAFGDRLPSSASPAALRALSAIYLLLPQIPMIFMGEEWGTARPFPFFCDFSGELGEAVRKGRREEFKRFAELADCGEVVAIPDPQALSTFESAKLDWAERERAPYQATLAWFKEALAVRRRCIVPMIPEFSRGGSSSQIGTLAVSVTWTTQDGAALRLDANLKDTPQGGFERPIGTIIWREGEVETDTFAPWSVRWSLGPQ